MFLEFLFENAAKVSKEKAEKFGEIINTIDKGNTEIVFKWLALSLKTKNYGVIN